MTTAAPDLATLHVLLVEDNPGDVLLMREAIEQADAPIEVHVAENAVQAFWFLGHRGDHADAPRPDVILLDLRLPVIDGHQALQLIKATTAWSDIPVIVLTSSALDVDRIVSKREGAIAFQTKPLTWQGYLELIDRFLACAKSGFRS